jgi:Fe-S cluster biogenesis protein NfuA
MALNKSDIEELVTTHIAQLLRADGGSIEVVALNLETQTLTVRFGGTYRGSPCRGVVLEHVVEPILKVRFSELNRVEMAD